MRIASRGECRRLHALMLPCHLAMRACAQVLQLEQLHALQQCTLRAPYLGCNPGDRQDQFQVVGLADFIAARRSVVLVLFPWTQLRTHRCDLSCRTGRLLFLAAVLRRIDRHGAPFRQASLAAPRCWQRSCRPAGRRGTAGIRQQSFAIACEKDKEVSPAESEQRSRERQWGCTHCYCPAVAVWGAQPGRGRRPTHESDQGGAARCGRGPRRV